MNNAMRPFCLLWQFPLSLLSFFYYRIIKMRIRAFNKKAAQNNIQNSSPQWHSLSEVLHIPGVLPHIMVTGPRWNCHAIIGSVGFDVQQKIRIHCGMATKSAAQWTIVIYNEQLKVQTYLSSYELKYREWHAVNLEQGRYSIVLRYYEIAEAISFPEIVIDEGNKIESRSMDNEAQQYRICLEKIRNQKGFFYLCLHYYVFHILCWKKCLGTSFVKKEYLPIGNPDTQFKYDALKKGDVLELEFARELLSENNVYIVIYNMYSFPISWDTITKTKYQSPRISCDGHYLVRIQKKNKLQIRQDKGDKT